MSPCPSRMANNKFMFQFGPQHTHLDITENLFTGHGTKLSKTGLGFSESQQ